MFWEGRESLPSLWQFISESGQAWQFVGSVAETLRATLCINLHITYNAIIKKLSGDNIFDTVKLFSMQKICSAPQTGRSVATPVLGQAWQFAGSVAETLCATIGFKSAKPLHRCCLYNPATSYYEMQHCNKLSIE